MKIVNTFLWKPILLDSILYINVKLEMHLTGDSKLR